MNKFKFKNKLVKSFKISFWIIFILIFNLIIFEPVYSKAGESTVLVNLEVASAVSVNIPSPVLMLPPIYLNGEADGETNLEIGTNSTNGWTLTLKSEAATPAMKKGTDNFSDYIRGNPIAWSVGANESKFGFTVTGDNAVAGYENGTKYRGLNGSNQIIVAQEPYMPVAPRNIRLLFKAEVGNDKIQPAGDYQAVVIATASAND
jgi:hypothetical protein